MHAGSASEGAAEGGDVLSDAGTDGESASATDAAVAQAQHAQREAMLVSHDSLKDSQIRLLEVREALQHVGHADDQPAGELQGEAIWSMYHPPPPTPLQYLTIHVSQQDPITVKQVSAVPRCCGTVHSL